MKHKLRMICVFFLSIVAVSLAFSSENAFAEGMTIVVSELSEATFNREVSFEYAIEGGSGPYEVTATWYIEGDDFFEIGMEITSGAQGTVSVIPRLTDEMRGAESYDLWLNVTATDSAGVSASTETSVGIAASEYEELILSVWFDATEATAGEEMTAYYRITGGQTPYTQRVVSARFYDDADNSCYEAFYDGTFREISAEGSFTFTPETGDSIQGYMEITDAENFTASAYTEQIDLIGGKKITDAFAPELSFEDAAELYLNQPVKVFYDLGEYASNYDSLNLRLVILKSDDSYSAVSDEIMLNPNDEDGEVSMLLNMSTAEAANMTDSPLVARIELYASDVYGRYRYEYEEKEIKDQISSAEFIPGEDEGEEFRVDVTFADAEINTDEPLRFEYAVSGGSGKYEQIYYDILDQRNMYCGSFSLYDASGSAYVTLRREGMYRLCFHAMDTDGRECYAESDAICVHGFGVSLSTSQNYVEEGETIAVAYEIYGGAEPYYLQYEWHYTVKDTYEYVSKKSFGFSEGTGEVTFVVPKGAEWLFLSVTATDANHAEGFAEVSFRTDEREDVSITYNHTTVEPGQTLTARYEAVNSQGNCELLNARWEIEESSIGYVWVKNVTLDQEKQQGEASLTAPLCGDKITFYVCFRGSDGEERESYGTTVINRGAAVSRAPLTIQVTAKSDAVRLNEPAEFEYEFSGWTGEYASANVNSYIYLYPVDNPNEVQSFASDAVSLDASETRGTFTLTPAVYDDVSWLPYESYDPYLRITVNVTDALGHDWVVEREFAMADQFRPNAVISGDGAGEPLSVVISTEQTECALGNPMSFDYEVRGGSGEYSSVTFDFKGENNSRWGRLYDSENHISLVSYYGGNHYLAITAVDANTGETVTGVSPMILQHGVHIRIAFDQPVYADGETARASYTVAGAPADATVSVSWYGWKNGEYFGYRLPSAQSEGTAEFTIDGEENVGLDIQVLGSHVNVSTSKSFGVFRGSDGGERFAFEFDRDKVKAGDTLTANYRFIGAKGGVAIENAYWHVSDQIGTGYWVRFEDQMSLGETGSFSFVPETGDSIELYIGAYHGDRYYACSKTIPIEGGVKVTERLSADVAQEGETAKIAKPFTVDYELSGLTNEYSSIRAEWAYSYLRDGETCLWAFAGEELNQKQGTITVYPTGDIPDGDGIRLLLTFYVTDLYGRSDSVSKVFALGGVSLDRAEVSVGETVSASYFLSDYAEGSYVKSANWIVTDTTGEVFALRDNARTLALPSGSADFAPQFGERLSFEIRVEDASGIEHVFESESIPISNAPFVSEPLSVRLSARDTPEFFKDFTVDYAISGWTGVYAELSVQWLLGYRDEAGGIAETESVDWYSSDSFDAAGCVTGKIIPGEIVTKENSDDMFVLCIFTVSDARGRQRSVSGMFDIVNEYAYPIPGGGSGEPLAATLTPDPAQILMGESVRYAYSVTGGTGEYTDIHITSPKGDEYNLLFAEGFIDINLFERGECAYTLHATDTSGVSVQTDATVQAIFVDATVTPTDAALYPGKTVTFDYKVESDLSVQSVRVFCREADGTPVCEEASEGAEGSVTLKIPLTDALFFDTCVTLEGGIVCRRTVECDVDMDGGIFLRTEQREGVAAGETLTVDYDLHMAGPFNFVGSEWIFRDDVGSQFRVAPVIADALSETGRISVVPESGDSVTLRLVVTDAVGRRFERECEPIPISGGKKAEEYIGVRLTPVADAEYQKLFALDYEISGGVGEYSRLELEYALTNEQIWSSLGQKTVANPGASGRASYLLNVGERIKSDPACEGAWLEVFATVRDAYGRSTTEYYTFDISGDFEQSDVIQGEDAGGPIRVEIVPDSTELRAGDVLSASYRVSGGTARYTSIEARLLTEGEERFMEALAEAEGKVSFANVPAGKCAILITATDTNGSVCSVCGAPVTVSGMKLRLKADDTNVKPGDPAAIHYAIAGGSGYNSIEATCTYEFEEGSFAWLNLGTQYASDGVFEFTVPECRSMYVTFCATDLDGATAWGDVFFNIDLGKPYAVFAFDRDEAVCGEPISVSYTLCNVQDKEISIDWIEWRKRDAEGSMAYDSPSFDPAAREGSFAYTPLENGILSFGMGVWVQDEYYNFDSPEVSVTGGEAVDPLNISVSFGDSVADFYQPIECSYSVSGWNSAYEGLYMEERFIWRNEDGYEQCEVFDVADLDAQSPSGTVTITPKFTQTLLSEAPGKPVKLEIYFQVRGIGGKNGYVFARCPIASKVPDGSYVIPGERAGEPLSVTIVPDALESTVFQGMSAAYEVTGGTGEYTSIECVWVSAYDEGMVVASESLYRASGAVRANCGREGDYVCVITARDTAGEEAKAVSSPIALMGNLRVIASGDWGMEYSVGQSVCQPYAIAGGSGAYTVVAELMYYNEAIYGYETIETKAQNASSGEFEFPLAEPGAYGLTLWALDDLYGTEGRFETYFSAVEGLTFNLTADKLGDLPAGEPVTVRYRVGGGSGEYEVVSCEWEIIDDNSPKAQVVARVPVDAASLPLPEGEVVFTPTMGERNWLRMTVKDCQTHQVKKRDYLIIVSGAEVTPSVALSYDYGRLCFGVPTEFRYQISGGSGNFTDFKVCFHTQEGERETVQYVFEEPLALTGREGTFTFTPELTESLIGCYACDSGCSLTCELSFTDVETGLRLFGSTWETLWLPAQTPHVVFARDAGEVRPAAPGADGRIGKLVCSLCGATIAENISIDGDRVMRLPSALTRIEDEAFRNLSMRQVTLPDGVTSIGSAAFAGCGDLVLAVLPDGIQNLSPNAFEGCEKLIILCDESNAKVVEWAIANGTPICFR